MSFREQNFLQNTKYNYNGKNINWIALKSRTLFIQSHHKVNENVNAEWKEIFEKHIVNNDLCKEHTVTPKNHTEKGKII